MMRQTTSAKTPRFAVVASTNFDAYTLFWPTVLDFGKPFPDQVFAAVIYGATERSSGHRRPRCEENGFASLA
jgi:hypothetical protein